MTTEEIRSRLRNVFQNVFEDEGVEFSDSLNREQVESWDSLGHIRLISAMEEAFGVRFTIEEIESLTSVGRIVECIEARV